MRGVIIFMRRHHVIYLTTGMFFAALCHHASCDELPPAAPQSIKISGTVVDAGTGQPIAGFTVAEGAREARSANYVWKRGGQTWYTNGSFVFYSSLAGSPPEFVIEAPGHVPQTIGPVPASRTNLDIRMNRYGNVEGTVLRPGGKPLANAWVYLTERDRSLLITGTPPLVETRVGYPPRQTKTDAGGHFAYMPQLDDGLLVVADDAGFAQARITTLGAKYELRLQAWAKIKGKLRVGDYPGGNESVHVATAGLARRTKSRQFPPVELFYETITDESGRFIFDHVPPMDIDVFYAPSAADNDGLPLRKFHRVTVRATPGSTTEVVLDDKSNQ